MHIPRDVVFSEGKDWDWGEHDAENAPFITESWTAGLEMSSMAAKPLAQVTPSTEAESKAASTDGDARTTARVAENVAMA